MVKYGRPLQTPPTQLVVYTEREGKKKKEFVLVIVWVINVVVSSSRENV